MEEGQGLEILRKQIDDRENELEEVRNKAMEETRQQIEKTMKLLEDKG